MALEHSYLLPLPNPKQALQWVYHGYTGIIMGGKLHCHLSGRVNGCSSTNPWYVVGIAIVYIYISLPMIITDFHMLAVSQTPDHPRKIDKNRPFLECVPEITVTILRFRKFRSQTSDNMDRWKAEQGRGREKRKIRRKKSKKKEDADARKGRKVAKHCVFSNDLGLRRLQK